MKYLDQAGDTIVEVMIAISVISLVLVGAFVSTNHNTVITQDAQERTQAVKLVETQLEYMRNAGKIATGHCFVNGVDTAPGASGSDPCTVISDGTQAGTGDEPAYTLSISCGASTCDENSVSTVQATWDAITGGTQRNVIMYYKP